MRVNVKGSQLAVTPYFFRHFTTFLLILSLIVFRLCLNISYVLSFTSRVVASTIIMNTSTHTHPISNKSVKCLGLQSEARQTIKNYDAMSKNSGNINNVFSAGKVCSNYHTVDSGRKTRVSVTHDSGRLTNFNVIKLGENSSQRGRLLLET